MNRLHPQDLRAIVAASIRAGIMLYPDTAKEKTRLTLGITDELLAELERTAKPEAPEPNGNCPEPACACPYFHGLTIPCNKCGHAPQPAPVRVAGLNDASCSLLEDDRSALAWHIEERARLQAELAQLKFNTEAAARQGWPEALRAGAAREERERIIAIITDPHNNILWIVPGSSHVHAIHADPRQIRTALEPREDPCS